MPLNKQNMQYTAIRKSGQPHTLNNNPVIITAHLKDEAKAKLAALLPLHEFKIVTGYSIQNKIEQGILTACFGKN